MDGRDESSADGCQALRSNEAQVSEHIWPLLQVSSSRIARKSCKICSNLNDFGSSGSVYLLPHSFSVHWKWSWAFTATNATAIAMQSEIRKVFIAVEKKGNAKFPSDTVGGILCVCLKRVQRRFQC